MVTNYATEDVQSTTATLNNKTAPIDAEERVIYKSYPISNVRHGLNIQHPSNIPGGILYRVEVQDTLVTEDSATDFRVDEPIVAALSISHPRSGNITGALVAQVVTRLISACKYDAGDWRFDDLMRMAERPVAD
jgi:hypothetical protein